ncbi:MAG: hypothetical protein QM613_00660 [Micrococcaceae bacterium]
MRKPTKVSIAILSSISILGIGHQAIAQDSSTSASPSASATPSPSETTLNYTTAVTPDQLQRILSNIAKAANAGDTAKDASKLSKRFTGPALDMRTGNYTVRKDVANYTPSASIGSASVMAQVIGKTGADFPRKMIVVSKADNQLVPQALLLVQNSARENYKVNMTAQLLPGSTFPQPLDLNYVADTLQPTAGSFKMKPQDALKQYGDVLDNSGGGKYATNFTDNQYIQQVKQFQATTTKNMKEAQSTAVYSHVSQPSQTVVMKTSKNSALVFGYYKYQVVLTPSDGGSINLPDEWQAMADGQEVSSTPVTVTYGETILMNVPDKNSNDKISVIGADQDIIDVSN